jgi:hypothetical protein
MIKEKLKASPAFSKEYRDIIIQKKSGVTKKSDIVEAFTFTYP